jgi:hypothetical protein
MGLAHTLLLLCAALLLSACPEEGRRVKVSDDLIVQAKFETAQRTLEDIRENRKRGRNIYADCKTAEMLFVRELKQLQAPPAKRLVDDLRQAAQGAKPL